jgi:hypothetical protein
LNKQQAAYIDSRWRMLPGGQGEHDFSLTDRLEKVFAGLRNYAENCGGLAVRQCAFIHLESSVGTWKIEFAQDGSRVVRIFRERFGSLLLYWTADNERVVDGYYQESNADSPALTDDPADIKQVFLGQTMPFDVAREVFRALTIEKTAKDLGIWFAEIPAEKKMGAIICDLLAPGMTTGDIYDAAAAQFKLLGIDQSYRYIQGVIPKPTMVEAMTQEAI